ncbi:hypothetical protein H2201_007001 [Coniosporium apollinis]|uniref:Autophagy-related protein 13 n=2 Tax=Coniosporium TaxID=2810619 RepID=A0ABQ9NKZ6_9PEZI|nr:hypothetical protein H2199_004836 [Cladosporium sp. JES 115]KAJ9660255.1 hypothetical protein H2201_007001 [Coniosporium apollinis]
MLTQTKHKDFRQHAEAYLTTTTVQNPRTGEVYETASKDTSEIYAAFYKELIGTFDSFKDEYQDQEYDERGYTDSGDDDGRDVQFERERPLVIEWPRDESKVTLWDDDVQKYQETWLEDSHDGYEQELRDLEAEPQGGSPVWSKQTDDEDELPNGGHPTSHDSVEELSSTRQRWLQLTTDSEPGDSPNLPRSSTASLAPSLNSAFTDNETVGDRIRETIIEHTLPHAPQPAPLTSPSLSPVSPTDLYDPIRRISIPRPPRVDSLLPLLRSGSSASAASSVYSSDEESHDEGSQTLSSRSSRRVPYTSATSAILGKTSAAPQARPLLAAVQHETDSFTDDPDTTQRDHLRASSLPDVRPYGQDTKTEQLRPTSLPAHMVLEGDEAEQMLALTGYVPLHRLSLEAHDELLEDPEALLQRDLEEHLRESPPIPKRHQHRPRPVQLERVSTHSLGKHADDVDEERYRRGSTSSSLAAYHAYDERTKDLSAPLERRLTGIRSFRSFVSLHRRLERYVKGLQQQTADNQRRSSYDESVVDEGLVGVPYSDTVHGPTPISGLTAESLDGRQEGNTLMRVMSRLSRKRSTSRNSTISTSSSITVTDNPSVLNIDTGSRASFNRLEAHRSPSSSNLHHAFTDSSHNYAFRGLTAAEIIDPARIARHQQGIPSSYPPSLISMEAPSLISRSATPRRLAARFLNPNLRPRPSFSVLSDSRPASVLDRQRKPFSYEQGREDGGGGSDNSSVRSGSPSDNDYNGISLRSVSVGSSATKRLRSLGPIGSRTNRRTPTPSIKTRRQQIQPTSPTSPGSAPTPRPSASLPSYGSPEAPSYHTFDPVAPKQRAGVGPQQGAAKAGEPWKSPTDRFVKWAAEGLREGREVLGRELGSQAGGRGRRGRLEAVREEDEGSVSVGGKSERGV